MKKIAFCLLALMFVAPIVEAKRLAPEAVAEVKHEGITYSAPMGVQNIGFVEARKGKKLIWRRQIYVLHRDTNLEGDIQDVYITGMTVKDGVMTITNESGSVYELNLETLEVKAVKGKLVEKK